MDSKMEQLMNDLLGHLTQKIGGLVTLVDEDYGQLDALKNGEPAYAVTFPCILVSMPQADWTNLDKNTQRGQVTLSVRLAFDCGVTPGGHAVAQAEAGGIAPSWGQRYRLADSLNEALQGWCFDGCQSAAMRTRSLEWALPAKVKVYEQQYAVICLEEAGQNNVS